MFLFECPSTSVPDTSSTLVFFLSDSKSGLPNGCDCWRDLQEWPNLRITAMDSYKLSAITILLRYWHAMLIARMWYWQEYAVRELLLLHHPGDIREWASMRQRHSKGADKLQLRI